MERLFYQNLYYSTIYRMGSALQNKYFEKKRLYQDFENSRFQQNSLSMRSERIEAYIAGCLFDKISANSG